MPRDAVVLVAMISNQNKSLYVVAIGGTQIQHRPTHSSSRKSLLFTARACYIIVEIEIWASARSARSASQQSAGLNERVRVFVRHLTAPQQKVKGHNRTKSASTHHSSE